MTGGLPGISSSWHQAPWDLRRDSFFQLNPCRNSPCVTSTLTRRWVCLWWICLAFCYEYKYTVKGSYNQRSFGQSFLVSSTHFGFNDQIFISVRQLQVCWYGAPSLMRGPVYYNVQYIYILHTVTWMYIQYIQSLFQSRLSTVYHDLSLVASA
jgi:hypothetical protein